MFFCIKSEFSSKTSQSVGYEGLCKQLVLRVKKSYKDFSIVLNVLFHVFDVILTLIFTKLLQ